MCRPTRTSLTARSLLNPQYIHAVSKYVKPALKNHPDEVVEVLARMTTKEGVTPEEYKEGTGLVTIGMEFMSLLYDKDLVGLFNSQGQDKKTSSGSATENTEVSEK